MAATRSSIQSTNLSSFIGRQNLTPVLTRLGKDTAARRAAIKDPKGFLAEHGIKLPRGVEVSIEQTRPQLWPGFPPPPRRWFCFLFCRRILNRYWVCWKVCFPLPSA